MPPRITQESYRPRVSNRTMVGTSAACYACQFQRTQRRHHPVTWNHRDGKNSLAVSRGAEQDSTPEENPSKIQGARPDGRACMPRQKYSRAPSHRGSILLTCTFIGHPFWPGERRRNFGPPFCRVAGPKRSAEDVLTQRGLKGIRAAEPPRQIAVRGCSCCFHAMFHAGQRL